MPSPTNWPLIIWLFLGEAVGYVWLLRMCHGRRAPGIEAFKGVVSGATLFLLAESIIMVVDDPAVQFLMTCLSFVSAGLIAPCVALLFAARTEWKWWSRPRVKRGLLAICLLIGGLRMLDPWTGWVSHQAAETTIKRGGINLILYHPSWGYWTILCMCAASAAICIIATVRAWPEASPFHRRQLLPMVLACVPPLLSEVLFNLNPAWTGYFDPTPAVLGLTVMLMGWTVLRSGFVAVAPMARAFLFEHLGKAVVAADEQHSIVDYNSEASQRFGWLAHSAVGDPLQKALANWPALAEFCQRDTSGLFECQSNDDAELRYWEATWHPLKTAQHERHRGYLLMLSDVTERKRTELALAEALAARTVEWERATKAAVSAAEEERRRIGRALHDNLCQDLVGLVRTTEAILASGGEATQDERFAGLTTRLQRASQHARGVAHLLEGPDLEWTSLAEALETILAQFESQFGLSCDLTISPHFPQMEPEPASSFLRIVRESVVNAVRHGGARRIWIDLTCPAGAATAIATISNDGTPLPPQPIEGLGMRQMRMRAALLGAQLSLEPGAEGYGARVRLQLAATPGSTTASLPTP